MIERRIRDIEVRSAPTVDPGVSTTEAARLLRRPDVPAVVVRADGAVTGLITESDIVAMVAETDAPLDVESVMTVSVPTVTPDSTLVEAAETMREAGIRHLPVVEGTDYRGLVSAETLAPYLSRHRLDIDGDRGSLRVETADTMETAIGD